MRLPLDPLSAMPWKTLIEIKMQRFPHTRKPDFQKRCEGKRWLRRHGLMSFHMTPARKVLIEWLATRHNCGRAKL